MDWENYKYLFKIISIIGIIFGILLLILKYFNL